ncbi:MAG TPA: YraN family protein [Steroidobacteraceae bacterium]|nr:YraN family protein [Steroidobacteraceae bacterium]
MDRRAAGSSAEAIACDFLVAHGLTLIARNYSCRFGELDLVMRDRGALAIVEVRSRASARFGGASESIDHRKRRRIVRAARHLLLARRELRHLPVRFDVVALDSSALPGGLEWIRGAFEAA